MINNVMTNEYRKCNCGGELAYYIEAPVVLDLYYCQKCYAVHEWDGKSVRKTLMEAYPNREKSLPLTK